MNKRPLAVTIIGCLLILTGVAGIATNLDSLKPPHLFQTENYLALLVRLLGVACGVFLLLRHNWARWAALVWIASHVAIGFLNSIRQGVIHAVIFVLLAWLLFRPQVTAWFRTSNVSA